MNRRKKSSLIQFEDSCECHLSPRMGQQHLSPGSTASSLPTSFDLAPLAPYSGTMSGLCRARQNRRDDFSRNAAQCDSPGQRPGIASSSHQALKGRHKHGPALSGLARILNIEPRALPWAISVRPLGAPDAGYRGAPVAPPIYACRPI